MLRALREIWVTVPWHSRYSVHSFQYGQFRNSPAWRKCLSLRWGGEATSGGPVMWASLILSSHFCLFRQHKPLAAASVADSLAAPLPFPAALPRGLMLSSTCPQGLPEGAPPSLCFPQTLLCPPTKWDVFLLWLGACFARRWELEKRVYLLIFPLYIRLSVVSESPGGLLNQCSRLNVPSDSSEWRQNRVLVLFLKIFNKIFFSNQYKNFKYKIICFWHISYILGTYWSHQCLVNCPSIPATVP